jgi:hypothetical protein
MAAMLAALFAVVLATPAHATYGSDCAGHTRTGGSGCKAEGTKFHDLDADGKRDSGEPGLAGWRIWADYDDDGVRDSGEAYDDTDSAGRYTITGIKPPRSGARTGGSTTYTKLYYRLREQRPGGGTGGWACTYPNASTSGGFGSGKGGDFGCGWGPIDAKKYPHKTGKDFGNYKKPKITVIKKLVPASDAGRFDLKVDGTTVKAGAGDGGSGSTYVKPGTYKISESAASGTSLSDYTASIECKKTSTRTGGGGDTVTVGSGDEAVCTITNTRKGKVEIAKVTEPAETGGRTFSFSGFAGDFGLAHGGVKTVGVLPRSEPYSVTEAVTTGYRLKAIACSDGDSTTSLSTRTASIKVSPGETVRCTFTNKKLAPGIQIVKSGPAQVHHGDTMEFTFAVTNTGNTPLTDVKVSDNRCSPVEPVETDAELAPGETWTYGCTKPVPSHAPGEDDPLCNVATATGKDEQGTTVTDMDEHCTDILHPAIDLTKQADRETAYVGDTITYTFAVTNPGDVGLKVTLTDPRCDAGTIKGPQEISGDGDELLDPDELWRYTCTHVVTASDPDPLPNTARATGEDPEGDKVEDEDSDTVDILQKDPPKTSPPAATPPAAQQQVLAATQQQPAPRGSARLTGPSGCVYRPFTAVVRGRQIRRVTFFLDGRRVVVRNARGGQRRFTARIRPGSLRSGVHRVTARVQFRTASRTRSRTLVLSFQRCVRLAPSPRFTG